MIHEGAARPFGRKLCDYGLKQPECTEPATWHLLWIDDNTTSNACDQHLQFVRDHATVEYLVHAFGEHCPKAGSWYRTSSDPEVEGFCYMDPERPGIRTEEAIEEWLAYDPSRLKYREA